MLDDKELMRIWLLLGKNVKQEVLMSIVGDAIIKKCNGGDVSSTDVLEEIVTSTTAFKHKNKG